MFSIAQSSLYANDGVELFFLYSNKTENDILCKDELNSLKKNFPDKFHLFYTLTRYQHSGDGKKWDGLEGRVSWEML